MGIYISNLKKHTVYENEYQSGGGRYATLECGNWFVQQQTSNKFVNDRVLSENEEYILLTDGIMLNSRELMEAMTVSSVKEYLFAQLRINGKIDFTKLRGSFVVAYYDKKNASWTVAGNQMGDRMVFYWHSGSQFICCSSLKVLSDELKENGYERTLNKNAAYNLLTFSFTQDNETLVDNAFRVNPGCFISFREGNLDVINYHTFINTNTVERTEDEYIELIDQKFRKAVKRQMEKDCEYGHEHLASLSSGLDARMTVRVATDLGYKVHTITFSESGFIDDVIADQLADHMRTTHMFMSLNDGNCMYNLEKVARFGYGMTAANHTMHAMQMMELLNLTRFGILHTGQIGDAVIGSLCESIVHEEVRPMVKPYSTKLAAKNHDQSYKKYANLEIQSLYTRAFRGALGAQTVHYNYIDMYSPFCDVDFFEFCMSIPLKYRVNHNIYKKWVIAKYNDVAQIVWGSTRKPITYNEHTISRISTKTIGRVKRVFQKGRKSASKNMMTPYDYWYSTYLDIRSCYDGIYNKLIEDTSIDSVVKNGLMLLYSEGTVREKMQSLTLLLSIQELLR